MIEENVGVLGDNLLLVDLVGVDVVKAVPLDRPDAQPLDDLPLLVTLPGDRRRSTNYPYDINDKARSKLNYPQSRGL